MNNGLFNFPNKTQDFFLPEKDNLVLWCKSDEFIHFNNLQKIFTMKNYKNSTTTGFSSFSFSSTPLLNLNILNGYPSIRFDGLSTTMVSNGIFSNSNFTIFLVTIPRNPVTNIIFEQDISWSRPSLESTASLNRAFYIYESGDTPALAPRPAVINEADIVTLISDNKTLQNCINGLRGTKVISSGNPSMDKYITLGSRNNNSYFSNFDFFEMIIYNKVLDLFTINKIENYLSKKYNIRLGI